MNRLLKIGIYAAILLLLPAKAAQAHEPIYGIGPGVLFKGGNAPHIGFGWNNQFLEPEYGWGYGITKNWTAIAEVPFLYNSGNYSFQGVSLKQKYRFYRNFKPGLSRTASAVAEVRIPSRTGGPTVVNLGLTAGQEARRWYWFVSGSYAAKFSGADKKSGNQLNYNTTLGIRPVLTSYKQPDLVLLLEGIGKYREEAELNGKDLANTGGHQWSIAPTFMLTYRNIALRGGVEIGLASAGGLGKPKTNFRTMLEYHF